MCVGAGGGGEQLCEYFMGAITGQFGHILNYQGDSYKQKSGEFTTVSITNQIIG